MKIIRLKIERSDHFNKIKMILLVKMMKFMCAIMKKEWKNKKVSWFGICKRLNLLN